MNIQHNQSLMVYVRNMARKANFYLISTSNEFTESSNSLDEYHRTRMDLLGLFFSSPIFVHERHPNVDHLEHIVQVLNANLGLNFRNHHWKIPSKKILLDDGRIRREKKTYTNEIFLVRFNTT